MYLTAGGVLANGIAKWNGTTWSDLNGGVLMGSSNAYGVNALTVYGNDLIAAGMFTTAGGIGVAHIARWNEPPLGVAVPSEMLFALNQNYPNPFNKITTVPFSLKEAGYVKLTVYDAYGREIKTLVNEYKQQGNFTIDFNADEYTPGFYFYTIELGLQRDTRKMLLLK